MSSFYIAKICKILWIQSHLLRMMKNDSNFDTKTDKRHSNSKKFIFKLRISCDEIIMMNQIIFPEVVCI